MDLTLLKELISSVGFPIVVAVFVLWRLEGTMKEMIHAVTGLSTVVREMNVRLDQVFERRAP